MSTKSTITMSHHTGDVRITIEAETTEVVAHLEKTIRAHFAKPKPTCELRSIDDIFKQFNELIK